MQSYGGVVSKSDCIEDKSGEWQAYVALVFGCPAELRRVS